MPTLPDSASSSDLPFPSLFTSLPVCFQEGAEKRQEGRVVSTFLPVGVMGRAGKGHLLQLDVTLCLLSHPHPPHCSPTSSDFTTRPWWSWRSWKLSGGRTKTTPTTWCTWRTSSTSATICASPLNSWGQLPFLFNSFCSEKLLKWQKGNLEVRTLDLSVCEHWMTRVNTPATQLSRKPRSWTQNCPSHPIPWSHLSPASIPRCAAQVLDAGLGDITETRPLPSRAKLKCGKGPSFAACPQSLALGPYGAEFGTQGSTQLPAQKGERALILSK